MASNSWDARGCFLFLAALFLFGSSTAQASEEAFYGVAQPVETAAGIMIVHVTYASYDPSCCRPVLYTCRQNALVTDSGVQDRNLASLIGIKAQVQGNVRKDLPDWMCDTLDVQLDLSAVTAHEKQYTASGIDEIVHKTIACIRENAWSGCRNSLKVMHLHITGPEKFRKLGGTFHVTSYRAGPVAS